MSRNPYHNEKDPPKLIPSVFVFMDILGYSELVKKSQADGTSEATLQSLHTALSEGRSWLEPEESKKWSQKDRHALKAFTDNIVIGWPIQDDAESELGDALFKLAEFQLEMVIEGYFIRGAISVGDAYVDEIAVFGGALIEAYDGESKLARDPRIILTKTAQEVAKKHLKYYPDPKHAPHSRYLLKDTDGQWFINYLECILWAVDEQGPFYEQLAKHKSMVEAKLIEHKGNPPIWSKYAWTAAYHNYFCDLYPEHFEAAHKIEIELYKQSPQSIIE